ncbi:MAG: ferrochelatase [Vicinamibacteria bacterium]
MMASPYDALLLLSFGGPEGMADVLPFIETVLRGKSVPAERLREVADHYERFGGVSPLNAQNRALLAAIEAELAARGPRLPLYWGNRNWHPLLDDTLRRMAKDGVKRALAFVTSAYSSYSGCHQYREDIDRARAALGSSAPGVDKLRAFYNHPGFIEANAAAVRAAFAEVPEVARGAAALVFTAHSIPNAMAAGSKYEGQLREAARLVSEAAGRTEWTFAYQSRSGSPSQPWLGPDIAEHLAALGKAGVRDVVVSPVGFVSDHMEVVYDLDIEARARAKDLGINMVRAPTAGTHPAFVSMVRDLVLERTENAPRRAVGADGPAPDDCASDCCPAPPAPPLGPRGGSPRHT